MKIQICFFFFLIALVFGHPTRSTSPTFLWSNYEIFESNKQIGYESSNQLAQNLQNLNFKDAELIVLFVANLPTESFTLNVDKFSNLKNLIHTSKSSMVIQFTSGDVANSLIYSLTNMISGSIFQVKSDTELESLQNLKTQVISMDQFLDLINSKWEIKNNGQTDLVIVPLTSDDFSVHDSYFEKVSTALVNTKYVSIVASIETFPRIELEFSQIGLSKFEMTFTQTDEGPSLFPMYIVEGVVIMLFFLFIFLLGVYCTFNLQSDLRYELEIKRSKS